MITTINDFLNSEFSLCKEVVEHVPSFFAHINKKELSLIAISPDEVQNENVFSLPIDSDLALKFLSGEENSFDWAVGFKNDKYELCKKEKFKEHFCHRIELLQIVEIPFNIVDFPDIKIVIDHTKDNVSLFYDGEKLPKWKNSVKLYFTRENDLAHLKCAFTLDSSILNKIMERNFLDEWPNPIVLPISNVNDLSVYTFKSPLKISIQELK